LRVIGKEQNQGQQNGETEQVLGGGALERTLDGESDNGLKVTNVQSPIATYWKSREWGEIDIMKLSSKSEGMKENPGQDAKKKWVRN